jgi:tetratricopeptide (TPR) repeat protein
MKKLIISIFLTAVFCFIRLTAQVKKATAREYWYTEAMRLYRLDEPTAGTDSTSLSLFLKYADAAGVYNPLAVQCLINAGNIHQGYQRFGEANALYRQAIQQNEKYIKKEAFAYEACLYLGSSFYFSNIIDSAQYYLEKASNIAMNYRGKDVLPEKSTLYNSLGAIYYESANYQQAKNYFELANKFIPVALTSADYTELYTSV